MPRVCPLIHSIALCYIRASYVVAQRPLNVVNLLFGGTGLTLLTLNILDPNPYQASNAALNRSCSSSLFSQGVIGFSVLSEMAMSRQSTLELESNFIFPEGMGRHFPQLIGTHRRSRE